MFFWIFVELRTIGFPMSFFVSEVVELKSLGFPLSFFQRLPGGLPWRCLPISPRRWRWHQWGEGRGGGVGGGGRRFPDCPGGSGSIVHFSIRIQ